MRRFIKQTVFAVFSLYLISSALGQQTKPGSKPQNPEEEPIVRLGTTLVQLDAVVTDSHGHIVRDLKADDFEVYEDGKLQKITNFSFISLEPRAVAIPATATAPSKPDKYAPPLSSKPVTADHVRRTIALVVDDLHISFEDMIFVRRSLKKFVNEDMQPGDLVVVITTAHTSSYQHFTTSKEELNTLIDRLQYYAMGTAGISSFAPLGQDDLLDPTRGQLALTGDAGAQLREDSITIGTLGTIQFLLQGMRTMPGRKSAIIMSGGF